MRKEEWNRLYDKNGVLVYEGFTFHGKACGAGASYFPDGKIYQEGIFGVKGFLSGREYYPDGKLRFEGVYELCKGYGPNYPRYGFFQTRDGSSTYKGEFRIRFGGVGFPIVEKPKAFGSILQKNSPDVPLLMWADEKEQSPAVTPVDVEEKAPTFDEFYQAVEKYYFDMEDTAVSRKYFNSEEARNKIFHDYAVNLEEFRKGEITRNVFMKGGASAVANCLNLMME